MTLAGVKKEIRDLKKEYAQDFKSIEELLNTSKEGLHKLTDDELFRILQYYNPELTREQLTIELLQKLVEEEA